MKQETLKSVWLQTKSVVCNSCHLFCKTLLEQYGEDTYSTDSIMQALTVKVGDLKERLQTSGKHHHCVLPFFQERKCW